MEVSLKANRPSLEGVAAALGQIKSRATARNVCIRVLTKAGRPIQQRAQADAPARPADAPPVYYRRGGVRVLRRPGTDKALVQIGTQLTPRQAAQARKAGKGFAVVYIGTRDPVARLIHNGTSKTPADPFLLLAWEGGKEQAFETVATEIWGEIAKAAAREARKAAR